MKLLSFIFQVVVVVANTPCCDAFLHLRANKAGVLPSNRVPLGNKEYRRWIGSSTLMNSSESLGGQESTADENGGTSDFDDVIAGRRRRVVTGYRAASLSYLGSAIIFLMAQTINPFLMYLVSGPVLVSGVTYILSGAALNDRLGSDTYKRLNLYTALYASIGLSLPILEPGVFNKPVFIVPPLLTLVNAVKGYTYGALGWDKQSGSFSSDLIAGTKSTVGTFFKPPKNIKAFGYLGASITVGAMKMLKLVQIIDMIQAETVALKIATRLLRFGRLAMLTAVLFTLKDAADRDRLEGTTFIELNFLSSFALASMSVYVASIGGSVNNQLAAAVGVMSLFTGYNGASSLYKKRKSS